MPRARRELEDLQLVFRALAHPSRRHILQVIEFRGGRMTAGEIAARFSCSWPTTTRHLRILRSAGLVLLEKRGRVRAYSLARSRLRKIVGGWLDVFARKP
jgi:DNA-binding transcriptional ArsR family regulator